MVKATIERIVDPAEKFNGRSLKARCAPDTAGSGQPQQAAGALRKQRWRCAMCLPFGDDR
jgi:hypothetical protein